MIPNELAIQFARGNGTLFVGAGLSMGCGLPSWKDLIDPLRKDIPGCPPDASLLDVAQYFANASSRAHLIGTIRERLREKNYVPSKAHHALLSLPVRRIYTTNYDDLLDLTFLKNNIRHHSIRTTDDLNLVRSQEPQLIKLHGDLDDVTSIVVTSSDYEAYLANKPALARLMASELQTKTVLFLGYSFNDHNLRTIMTQVSAEPETIRRNLYTIQHNPSPAVTEDFGKRGLVVIPLDLGKENPSALADWLMAFARSIRTQDKVPVPIGTIPRIVPLKNESPTPLGKLIGREAEFERVVEGLRCRYPVVAIEGPPGVGKRRLALEVANFCGAPEAVNTTERVTFEFITWLAPKTNPKTSWLEEALNAVATVMDDVVTAQSEQLETKLHTVESLLRSYKVLIVIDNYDEVQDAQLGEWITNIPYPSKVLLTTTAPVPLAWPVRVGGLGERAALALARQFARDMGVRLVERASDKDLLPLIKKGNPQALKLALGILKGGTKTLQELEARTHDARGSDELMTVLFEWSWSLLPEPSKTVLLATCVFSEAKPIEKEALRKTAGESPRYFDEALEELLPFHLVEKEFLTEDGEAHYRVHPVVRGLARLELERQPELEAAFRARCSGHFFLLVKSAARRDKPTRRYWTSLVSSNMRTIDAEWPSIEEAIRWAERHEPAMFVDFVLHLVHYMDSRFLNRERLEYVRTAADLLHQRGAKLDEALLRIDSLGWTYVEEGDMDEACKQIEAGLRLLDEFEQEEKTPEDAREAEGLRALAGAWQARAASEQGDREKALQCIGPALAMHGDPWIRARVLMVAGDMELSALRHAQGLGYYEACAEQMRSYGEEGGGYQTDPRIGLAHIGLAHLGPQELDKAQAKFESLKRNDVIKIGGYYADYGLALIAYKRGSIQSARDIGEQIKTQLQKQTKSNLLIGLIDKLNRELEPPDTVCSASHSRHDDVPVEALPVAYSVPEAV